MPPEPRPTSHPVLPDTRTLPLYDTISKQAEKLWKRYGSPQGRDNEIWAEAQAQVLGTDRDANQQSGGAVAAAPLGDVFYPPVQPNSRTEPTDDQGERRGDAKLAPPGADTGLPK